MNLRIVLRKFFLIPFVTIVFLFITGCDDNDNPTTPDNHGFNQKNLVADTIGFHDAIHINSDLVNAWGIATGDNCTKFFISANHTGKVLILDKNGNRSAPPINIPGRNSGTIGSPTGIAYNTTSSFVIPGTNQVSKLLIASEDGVITAWSADTNAVIVAGGTDTIAVYKGLAIASDGGFDFIYAANFKEQRIDVFNENFTRVTTKPFADPSLPFDYGPFNIHEINGYLFVTYAKRKAPDFLDDESGSGHGYVDIFTKAGVLVRRFASQGDLNSPWGMVKAPQDFPYFGNAILIGNFGDGHISAFDYTGLFLGQIDKSEYSAMEIEGLWGLLFADDYNFSSEEKLNLYFTAGPDDEKHGLFGFLRAK